MKRLLALPLALAACHVHHVEYDDPPVYAEVEPNDSVFEAPLYAGLRAGSVFSVRGHITEFGADVFDGVAVRADEAVEIRFDLYSDLLGTDLDVCVYDPDLGAYVVCEDGFGDPEHGAVVVLEPGKVIHLVVSSAHGSTGYRLDVHALAPTYGIAAQPPTDEELDAARAAKRERMNGYALDERPIVEQAPARVFIYDLESGERTEQAARSMRVDAKR